MLHQAQQAKFGASQVLGGGDAQEPGQAARSLTAECGPSPRNKTPGAKRARHLRGSELNTTPRSSALGE